MIHFAIPDTARRRLAPIAIQPGAAAHPPMTPAEYLRLRRSAAKLTPEQAALRMAPNHSRYRADMAALLRLLETPGAKARSRSTLVEFQRAFPIDVAVYFQLRDAPLDQHPRICRGCGCSHFDPCVSADGHTSCGWTSDTACSRCAGETA